MLTRLDQEEIRMISFEESEYPECLRRICDPPPVLFIKGRILPEDGQAIAVVGSRQASAYGVSICEHLVQELVRQGFCIVSGMARGVDAVAHWASLENQGRTMGVLGTGPDRIYPKGNAPLFQKIPRHGALLSEYLPGTPARPENFPRRNRIISGLACGVLVVEASVKSGTMITVRMALEQGREVFAVPGDIRSPLSKGTHRLIQQGAKLVEGVEDVLEELTVYHKAAPFRSTGSRPSFGSRKKGRKEQGIPQHEGLFSDSGFLDETGLRDLPSEGENLLMDMLNDQGVLIDNLIQRTGWAPSKMTAVLTQLELLGKVERLPGNRILRRT